MLKRSDLICDMIGLQHLPRGPLQVLVEKVGLKLVVDLGVSQ